MWTQKNMMSGKITKVWFTSAQSFEEIGDMPPIYKEGNVLIAKDIENIKKGLERVFDYIDLRLTACMIKQIWIM